MAKKIIFEIVVENVGAARRLEAVREEIRRLTKELKGAEIGSPVFRDIAGRLADAKIQAESLKDAQKQINREFQAARVPSDSLAGLRLEYSRLTDQIKVLSATQRQSQFGQDIIKNAAQVKKEIDGIEQSIGRFTGNVGNYRSAFQGLQQVLFTIGAGIGVNEIIQQNTRLSDSIANVAKTTGLTIEQAEQLSEVLKFRDTRTSLADQLKITEIGGQLGIATDQLEAFTAGVDVLNVALGDQFGNVDILTREFAGLRNVLTDFKTEDAAQDILHLGNAVNFLEAQGNATGQSIVDFAGRIAGAGVPLGATTADIIGLSTALSELSINPERGATAVSRLLAELAKSPATFAKAIGESEAEFTKLVQTDIVGALALVSEKIAGSADTNTVFAKTLDDLGIGAQGAIEVFGKLGGSTDLLRQRIAEAGQTLANTDSITREFEVKNNNAAAAVDKLRNAIIAAFTGTGAQEAIAAIANSLTGLVKGLSGTVEFFAENQAVALEFAAALIYLNGKGILQAIPLLKTLVTSLGLYTVAADGSLIATNALTTAQGRAVVAANLQTVATRALGAAQAALPFVAVIAATYALVAAWDAYQESASASEKAARTLAEAQGEIAQESAKEVAAVQKNIEILKFDIDNKEARKKAIDELKAAYPEYLRGIDLEKASISELARLQDQLTESIIRSIAERRKAAAQEEIAGRLIDKQLELQKAQRAAPVQVQAQQVGQFAGAQAVADIATGNAAQSAIQNINKIQNEIQSLKQEFDETGAAFDDAFGTGEGGKKLSRTQQDLIEFNAELSGQFKTTKIDVEGLKTETTNLGNESETTGKKIKGLGDKTKDAKDEIQAQAGSVAALRKEISDLQRRIDATSPDNPALAGMVKRLDTLKKSLEDAEKALKRLSREPFELKAPEIKDVERPELKIQTELEVKPDAAAKAKQEAQELLKRQTAIEFPIDLAIKPLTDAEKAVAQEFFDLQRKQGEADAEKRKKEAEEQKAFQEQLQQSSLDTAQTISGSLFEIQRNRLDAQTQLQLDQLDLETQAQIAAAKGNETKIAAIEKQAAIKRAAIEKEAARERKRIAQREAIINTALAVTKALTGAPPPGNLILAAVALAAGIAQQAVIASQEFAAGGVVLQKPKRQKPGVITERQNAPRTAQGDTVLAYLAPREMVLNELQQRTVREIAGEDVFKRAGVPGESLTRRAGVPGYAVGGIVGVVPQNGFNPQIAQNIQLESKAEFSGEQVDSIGTNIGRIVAAEVASQLRFALAEGLLDANRRLERESIANEQRQG